MNKNTIMPTSAIEETPYNPDDLDSVEDFWEGSRIEHKGKVIGISHRIKECESAKVQVTLTLSPRVIDFFKNTSKDWQARMDEALLEYIEAHHA